MKRDFIVYYVKNLLDMIKENLWGIKNEMDND